jgi:hypothetical protein
MIDTFFFLSVPALKNTVLIRACPACLVEYEVHSSGVGPGDRTGEIRVQKFSFSVLSFRFELSPFSFEP